LLLLREHETVVERESRKAATAACLEGDACRIILYFAAISIYFQQQPNCLFFLTVCPTITSDFMAVAAWFSEIRQRGQKMDEKELATGLQTENRGFAGLSDNFRGCNSSAFNG
jgi:hypothetical protein